MFSKFCFLNFNCDWRYTLLKSIKWEINFFNNSCLFFLFSWDHIHQTIQKESPTTRFEQRISAVGSDHSCLASDKMKWHFFHRQSDLTVRLSYMETESQKGDVKEETKAIFCLFEKFRFRIFSFFRLRRRRFEMN